MYVRYHILTKQVPSKVPVPKVLVARDLDRCVNCGTCVDSCLYGVHERRSDDPRAMAEPLSPLCRSCFRCVQECPENALALLPNPQLNHANNGLLTPKILTGIAFEAEGGAIPVSGAGYRGLFAGPGFDSIWTDMSEIVRPTRDGIHGREYISTAVDFGRKPLLVALEEEADAWQPPRELQVPFLFNLAQASLRGENAMRACVRAAKRLRTLTIAGPATPLDVLDEQPETVLLHASSLEELHRSERLALVPRSAGVELELNSGFESSLAELRRLAPGALLGVRIAQVAARPEMLDGLLEAEVDFIHLAGLPSNGHAGAEVEQFIAALRSLHLGLVERHRRDEFTLLASGPIVAAEHIPKTIILGADAVALDLALYIALECQTPRQFVDLPFFRADLPEGELEWGVQRLLNLSNAWRDQLLEVLGAMGLREIRRLRGEIGRSILNSEAEQEAFGEIRFKEEVTPVAR